MHNFTSLFSQGPIPTTNEIAVSDMKFIISKEECKQKLNNAHVSIKFNELTNEMHCITGETASSCLVSKVKLQHPV